MNTYQKLNDKIVLIVLRVKHASECEILLLPARTRTRLPRSVDPWVPQSCLLFQELLKHLSQSRKSGIFAKRGENVSGLLCSEKALKKLGLAFELSDLHEPFFYSKIVILRDSKVLACSFVAVLTIRVSFQESQNTRNQGRDPLGQNFRNLRYKIKWNAQQKCAEFFS